MDTSNIFGQMFKFTELDFIPAQLGQVIQRLRIFLSGFPDFRLLVHTVILT